MSKRAARFRKHSDGSRDERNDRRVHRKSGRRKGEKTRQYIAKAKVTP